jgi:hypothetical protein
VQVNSSYCSVGPPLFAYPQIMLLPGSTATANISCTPFDGNDLHTLLSSGFSITAPNFGLYSSISSDRYREVDAGSTGLTLTYSPIVYLSNESAYQIITITVAPNATSATYAMEGIECPNAGGY